MIDSYETLTHEDFYLDLTERLVALAAPPAGGTVLDLGCGTAAALDVVTAVVPDAGLWGVDPDPGLLGVARRRLGGRATLLEGTAEHLDDLVAAGTFDAVLMGNCVHLFGDLPAALMNVRRCCRPGARVALDTTFYDAGDLPEERGSYWRLVLEAQRALGGRGVARARRVGSGRSRPSLTEAHLVDELVRAGFVDIRAESIVRVLGASTIRAMVTSPMFATVVLPGVPPDDAAAALGEAVAVLDRDGDFALRRRFLFVGAAAPGGPT